MPTDIPRRRFLAGSLAATAACATSTLVADDAAQDESRATTQEFYEVRTYRCPSAEKQTGVLDYVASALVPALDRLGCGPVGVFTPTADKEGRTATDVTLVVPYPTLDLLGRRNEALAGDDAYQAAAAKHFAGALKDPEYSRIESRLLKAFAGMPRLAVPKSRGGESVFELRIYESHNEHKAGLKVAMFNEGEIAIMQDVGLAPVFFGEALIAGDLPNLTYMLSAESPEAHAEHWNGFRAHPEWNRMKVLPRYADTVSKITSITLRPAEGSQI
jgi:hypothetical protein